MLAENKANLLASTYRYTYVSARRDGFGRREALRMAVADILAGIVAKLRRVP